MSDQILADLLRQMERLPPADRLLLASRLIEGVRRDIPASAPRPQRKWGEVYGAIPHPALGEDAQEYITRTRREADEARDTRNRHIS